ncbi:DUF6228 family protein [Nocardioides dilutus]
MTDHSAHTRTLMPMSGSLVSHALDMEPVVIGDATTTLIFSDPDPVTAVPSQLLTVTLDGPDLRASRQVYEGYDGGFSTLATYFADLAADWRGWKGSRDYRSIEGDLSIEATHDGHVNLQVLLWESSTPGGWRVEAKVRLDAGEALTAAAKDIAELVRAWR